MFELSNSDIGSVSKILTEIESNDTLLTRRFFYTALAAYNPWCEQIEAGIEKAISYIIKNDINYSNMSETDLAANREIITIGGIEYFFDRNPELCTFDVSYESFHEIWFANKPIKNTHASILRAANQAVKSTYSRTNERVQGNKKTNVHEAMTIFRKITVDGLNSIKIQLNGSFMPYLVLLTEVFSVGYSKFPIHYLSSKNSLASLMMTVFVLRYFRTGGGAEQILRFDVKSLRNVLGCNDKYPTFKELKRNINKGIVDIAEIEDNGFTIEIINSKLDKKGHNITHVSFRVVSEELNNKKTFTDEQVAARNRKKQTPNAFAKAISFQPKSQTVGVVKSPIGWDKIKRQTGNK